MKNFTKITTCLLIALALGATVVSCKKDVDKVEVTPTILNLKVGASSQLTAKVTPAKAEYTLEWTSSATNVATVNADGKVTAVANGTATITVKAGDKTAECKVTVTTDIPAGVVLDENFNGSVLPTGWSVLDSDGDAYTWAVGQQAGRSGSNCMISASFINNVGPLTPDNWLITPKVQLNGKAVLTFWVTAQDEDYAAEHYGVYISTTGTSASNFTLLFEETFGDSKGKGGAKDAKVQATWRQKTINLTNYTGDCYIAIRHFNCSDEFYLNLDDLKIENK